MRAAAVLLVPLLALPGCARSTARHTRMVDELDVEVTAPKGVTGSARCQVNELKGGTYGKPRYEVWFQVHGLEGPRLDVYYDAQVEAGGRVYDGYLSNKNVRHIPGRAIPVLPWQPFGELQSHVFEAAGNIGVQQVPAGVTACRLTISAPTEQERIAGGRQMPNAGDQVVVVDPDGNERSPALE